MKLSAFKKIFIVVFLGLRTAGYTQCPDEIYLSTQNQVDSFSHQYPDCHQVNDLFISMSGNITNLKGLKVLHGHQNSIGILAFGKEINFEGLENIDSIEYLGITESRNTTGFSHLKYIDYLYFKNESNFDLSGFSILEHINNCVLIGVAALNGPSYDLLAFPNIKFINSLSLTGNFQLPGVEKVDSISWLIIKSNYVLKNLEALSARKNLERLVLSSVWTDFSFTGTELIKDLKILSISNGKKIMTLDGLKNIENIEFMSLDNITEFVPQNLKELSDIKGIKGLYINKVNGLQSLEGFPASDTLHELFLKKNKHLSNISALEKVKNIGFKNFRWELENGIEITDNPLLSECSVRPVCEMLKNFPDSLKLINNNGPNCGKEEDILSKCISSVSSDSENDTHFYPNPTFDQITPSEEITVHRIFNGQGICVSDLYTHNQTIDLSDLSPGIYFLHYTKNKGNVTRIHKVIKL
jgi:hypothetical protein